MAKPKEPPATQDAAPDEKAKEPSKEPAKQPAREPAKTASSKQTKQVTEEERKPAAQPPETKLAENTPANEQPASSQPNASAPPLTPGDNPPVADRAKPEEAAPAPFIPVEKPPQIIKLERPDFSSVHVQNGTEGQVVVQVQIDQQGKAVQTKILKTTNPLLNPPVIEAVMKSQFAPGQMAAGPVVSWLTIPYRFRFTE